MILIFFQHGLMVNGNHVVVQWDLELPNGADWWNFPSWWNCLIDGIAHMGPVESSAQWGGRFAPNGAGRLRPIGRNCRGVGNCPKCWELQTKFSSWMENIGKINGIFYARKKACLFCSDKIFRTTIWIISYYNNELEVMEAGVLELEFKVFWKFMLSKSI